MRCNASVPGLRGLRLYVDGCGDKGRWGAAVRDIWLTSIVDNGPVMGECFKCSWKRQIYLYSVLYLG